MSRYVPSHRRLSESLGEYNDRLRAEEREWEHEHREELAEERERFDREMREANGEEYPGADSGW